MRVPRGFKRAPFQSHEGRPTQETETLQREPQIRMQKAARFQLYHSYADRGCHGVLDGGDPCCNRNNPAYYLKFR